MSYQLTDHSPLYEYDETTKTLTLLVNIMFNIIPEGPETLILHPNYNHALPKLPNTITEIVMGDKFNQQIELPANLTHLTMGIYFNHQIELPSSLTHLIMGGYFNQSIVLPSSLTHLTMGHNFNCPIILPSSLTHLKMEFRFNWPIVLSPNLTQLTMGATFNHLIKLPSNLTHLFVGRDFSFIDKLILPASLKVFGVRNTELYHKLEKKKDILYVYCPSNDYMGIKFYMNGVTSKEYEKNFYEVDIDYCNDIMSLPEFKSKTEEELLKEQIIQLQKEVAEYKVKCEKIDEIIKKLYQPITNV